MKIGILCHSTYGGSGVVAAELGKQLARRGHQIHFVTIGRPFRLDSYQHNVFVHEVNAFHHPLFEVPPYFLTQVNKTVEVMRRYQLDLLHAHYAIPHSVGAHLARQILGKHVPVVTTLHGTDTSLVGAHQEFFAITSHGLAVSDAVTVVSNFLAQQTRATFSNQRELKLIYNFVDSEVFKPGNDHVRKSMTRSGESLLIHISNFRPLKRAVDVVEVFNLVRRQKPCRLILIGDGPDMPLVQRRVGQLGLNNHVIFLGQQDAVAPILAAADVMLLPSCCESFGLVALEALSCGVPVIATTAGGIPEVIEHGQVGFLTGVGDIEKMAEYTLLLLSNNELRHKMSVQARQHAINRFNPEYWVAKYEEVYRSVLNQ
ncbi:glycosyl transferase group 1 [Desulfotomaculum nigrificans CO-1-SRB]|uniref:Glycosyl transferase group 1 n=1 Tax=Desulfotomaculum nigrificans (strain DSM 14880 / VKM B-2319 / CO-1-SRB) TaxID=868595 RepID=F6B7K3_DESCC|nr:N-acetyl-alpha-D-glucosaminyl L-malate synthase BshA [Desulfotomaculum nigrificans]AEF94557.1 glycosyl transferase group 1 [Desulfotomaculum nigrificans CO-1-SRB]